MISLVVFDLDGTLLDTGVTATDRCFVPVFRTVFGPIPLSEDWATYPEATSAAILHEVSVRHRGRMPTKEETSAIQDHLDAMMRDAFLHGTERIARMPGANRLLGRLRRDPGSRIAVATGNWTREAGVKIESATLDLAGVPMATSDDRMLRREILPLAVERASAAFAVGTWSRIVYVGDRPWDAAAARANGIGFVGVGTGERAEALRAAGARFIFPDFLDSDAVLLAFAEAEVP